MGASRTMRWSIVVLLAVLPENLRVAAADEFVWQPFGSRIGWTSRSA